MATSLLLVIRTFIIRAFIIRFVLDTKDSHEISFPNMYSQIIYEGVQVLLAPSMPNADPL